MCIRDRVSTQSTGAFGELHGCCQRRGGKMTASSEPPGKEDPMTDEKVRAAVDRLFEAVDLNSNGWIDLDEFVVVMKQVDDFVSRDHVEITFRNVQNEHPIGDSRPDSLSRPQFHSWVRATFKDCNKPELVYQISQLTKAAGKLKPEPREAREEAPAAAEVDETLSPRAAELRRLKALEEENLRLTRENELLRKQAGPAQEGDQVKFKPAKAAGTRQEGAAPEGSKEGCECVLL
eukprot:TRINITY_DN2755_c0_g1_i1.p1 TRINITY_DN2755_c0_g1~~TRINITY_DN2755_c0_g1_i1.p1  ORF type:complete len:234 (+),score=51.76 TRINITY_DN2755_c0_g1_i1:164-865(+)